MNKKIILSLSVSALLTSSLYANVNSGMGGGHNFNQKTTAYFGDKQNNQIDIVDVNNMKLIKTVKTNNQKTYAAQAIKTMNNHHDSTPKMYVSNRGSDSLDVLDSKTNKIIKSIKLPFHPRSIDVNKRTGLVLVSGVDKPMMAVINNVGSDEGNLFVIDYSSEKMKIIKSVKAGLGAGHMDEMKHGYNDMAIIINHKDKFITLMDTRTNNKIADITVSLLPDSKIGEVQTQSHPKYYFSPDGKYFYMFLTEEGSLVKVDLIQKKVVKRLKIGGKIAMGTFVH